MQSSSPSPVKPRILVDSGAFSAWKLGKVINPANYEAWLRDNTDWITDAVALDYIDPVDVDIAARRSFESFEAMRGRGVTTIPVWHRGEPVEWLDRMVASGVNYIALSGTAGDRVTDIYRWYDYAWDRLSDEQGRPLVRVHCLADTRYNTLTRYPWYSADSATLLLRPGFAGKLQVSDGVTIAMRKDSASSAASRSLESLDPHELEEFHQHCRTFGVNPAVFQQQGRPSTQMLMLLDAHYQHNVYQRVRKLMPIRHKRTRGFFDNAVGCGTGKDQAEFVLYLSVGTNWRTYPILSRVGLLDTLQSFYYVNGAKHAQFMRQWLSDPAGTAERHEWCARTNAMMLSHIIKEPA